MKNNKQDINSIDELLLKDSKINICRKIRRKIRRVTRYRLNIFLVNLKNVLNGKIKLYNYY